VVCDLSDCSQRRARIAEHRLRSHPVQHYIRAAATVDHFVEGYLQTDCISRRKDEA
jgi:hypothetical protein